MLQWNDFSNQIPSVLTIVGMAKNVGKTVTLNYVQRKMHEQKLPLALTSIGRDGESFDVLTNLSKPSIVIRQGTIVATAEGLIGNPDHWECLQKTNMITPLGKIIILKAKVLTSVVLAGPSKNAELKQVLKDLKKWGAKCILIDGAFDRQSSVDPLVSRQVILASGATLSLDMNQLILMTKARVEQFMLPVCSERYLELFDRCAAKVTVINDNQQCEHALDTPLLNSEEWSEILGKHCDALLLKGAVGDGLAQALMYRKDEPVIVIQDSSKIFISAFLWRQLRSRNIRFQVTRPIRLLGVTINPTCPKNKGIDPELLLQTMGKALAPISVFDVVREVKFN